MDFRFLNRHLSALALSTLLSFAIHLSAWATPEEGDALRSFLTELVTATSESDTREKAESVRMTFAHHPEIFDWISKNRDAKELLRDADLTQLDFAVDAISPKGSQTSHVISSAFSQWLSGKGASERIVEVIETSSQRVLTNSGVQRFLEETSKQRNPDEWLRFLRSFGDAPFLEVSRTIERAIDESHFSISPALKGLTDAHAGVDIQGVPAELKSLFANMLGEYFDALSGETKREIVREILTLPRGAPVEKQISIALNHSGPALQKLFQLFGKDARSPRLRQVLEDLKSNVEPVDAATARSLVARSMGQPFEEVFFSMEPKPLGAGTVGQAHLATLKSGKQVVLKIRRPGIIEEARREIDVFRKLAGGKPAQEEIVRRLEESLLSEMSFIDEARNTRRGARYNNSGLGLQSVTLAKEVAPREDLLALDFAPGKPLSKLTETELVGRGQALVNFLDRWVHESIFETGFFHGDPHSDNLLYASRPGNIPPFELTIIDFGSADILSLRQRRAFARLMAGVVTNSKKELLASLKEVATFPGQSFSEFETRLGKMNIQGGSISGKLNQVLSVALDSGGEIPSSFLKYNRGRMFFEGQIDEVNEKLAQLDPGKKRPRFSSTNTYFKVGARGAVRDLARQIFRLEHAKRSVITTDLVLSLFQQKALDLCKARFGLLMRY